ncbi:hypothetical protein [Paraburkholderia fungorum]|uniref:hypothetical protein n=1 Tax=Paraburkholderia fungorum TaxID=134537 RepID=UPI00115FEE49|nr:hypothetical protein [Paraburkholderia fungorum]
MFQRLCCIFRNKAAQNSSLQRLSERKHFFRFFTDYFSRVMDYFPACSDLRAKRAGCRPLIDKKGDAHVHLSHLAASAESVDLSADLQPA